MNLPDTNSVAGAAGTNLTVMARLFHHFSSHEPSPAVRIVLIVVLAVLVHMLVGLTRNISSWLITKSHAERNPLGFVTQQPKFVTLIQLIASGVTFILYFFAIGLMLEEFGVDLKEYLASASILGLAISFGSQGLVQDVVISLTLIFSDAMDVGDMVEIVGTNTVIGRVEEIGLRFTTLHNLFNQRVFIPNRTIANVSRFPQGGVVAYADVQLPPGVDAEKAAQAIQNTAQGIWAQFEAIILNEPLVNPVETVPGGEWRFVRVHFKIWPGQGGLIENTFRQQVVNTMKVYYPAYADWQVAVTYRAITGESDTKPAETSADGAEEATGKN